MKETGKLFYTILLVSLLSLTFQAQSKQSKPIKESVAESEEAAKIRKAAELFDAGQNAHQRGELEKAVELYEAALKLDPALWQIELQLSNANFSLKRYGPARIAVKSVLTQLAEAGDAPELKPFIVRAQLVLGEIALAEAHHEEAASAFQRALELNPQAYRARAGLAEVLLAQQKFAEAAALAKSAIESGDTSTATQLLLAEALIKQQRPNEALATLNEILKREPQYLPALRQRAEILLAQGAYNQAIQDLRTTLMATSATADKMVLANAYLQAKLPQVALGLYQQIVKEDPANLDAQRNLAGLLVETGKAKEAIAQLEALLQAEPNNGLVRAQLAELYLVTSPEKALEQYSAAAKLAPENPAHKIGMATALVKLRRFQEAVPLLRGVLDANPKGEIVYFAHTNLATALFELDDFANAAREFVWILEHAQERKRTTIALYFLGICFDKLGDYQQALKAYEQFLALAGEGNQLEVDKIKLRLPSLQRQIKEGKGIKKKP